MSDVESDKQYLDKKGLEQVWENIKNYHEASMYDYYNKEEVDTKLDNLPTSDLSNYYNKEEVNGLIKGISVEAMSANSIDLSTIEEICQ